MFKRLQTEWKLTQARYAVYVLQKYNTRSPSGMTRSHTVRLLNDALSTALVVQHRIRYFLIKNKMKQDRQCTYKVTMGRVREAIRTTYSENVFAVLGIQQAMRMRHIVIRSLSGSTVFFHIIS